MKIGLIILIALIGLLIYYWQTISECAPVKFMMRIPYLIAIIAAIIVIMFPRNYDEMPDLLTKYWNA